MENKEKITATTQKDENAVVSSIKDFFKRWWKDSRNYKDRMSLSLLCGIAFAYTFVFFGPLELTVSNLSSVDFTVADTATVMGVLAVIVLAIIAFALPLIKGKFFNAVLTVLFSFTVCGYIQGTFLNGSMGQLTGDAIAWNLQKGQMILNTIIWIIIFLIPIIFLKKNKKLWRSAIAFMSVLIVISQTIALITLSASSKPENETGTTDTAETYLSTKDLVNYSSESNMLVFLVDRLDYDYIEEVFADDQSFFDGLDGFTLYTDVVSEFARTKPAANYLLTNYKEGVYKTPQVEFLRKSWDQGDRHMIKDLNGAGYTVDFYGEAGELFGDAMYFENQVDNISSGSEKISPVNLAKNLLTVCAYRYLPLTMKPFFWTYSEDVNKDVFADSERYEVDETILNGKLKDAKTTGSTKYFKYYHFMGSHSPCILNADGTKCTDGNTTTLEQTKGSLQIVFNTLNKLKELGVYDKTSVLILGDHGAAISDSKPVQKATTIGLFYKPAGASGTPFKTDDTFVSVNSVPATIMKSVGLNYSAYGTPLDEVVQNPNVVREFYKSTVGEYHEDTVYHYNIVGTARNFANWKIVDTFPATEYFY